MRAPQPNIQNTQRVKTVPSQNTLHVSKNNSVTPKQEHHRPQDQKDENPQPQQTQGTPTPTASLLPHPLGNPPIQSVQEKVSQQNETHFGSLQMLQLLRSRTQAQNEHQSSNKSNHTTPRLETMSRASQRDAEIAEKAQNRFCQTPVDANENINRNTSLQSLTTTIQPLYNRLHDNRYLDNIIINDTLKKLFNNRTQETYINTYFHSNLRISNVLHGAVRRGYKALQQPEIRDWYVPVHYAQHWLFLHIHRTTKTITQYDSLMSTEHHGHIIKTYLDQQTGTSWTLKNGIMRQQNNGYDCGAYMLAEIQQKLNRYNTPIHWTPNRMAIYVYLTQNIHTSFYQNNQHPPHPHNTDRFTQRSDTTPKTEHKNCSRRPLSMENASQPDPTLTPTSDHIKDSSPNQCHTQPDPYAQKSTEAPRKTPTNFEKQLLQEIHQGHQMQPKQENVIRIYSQNIDGISTKHPQDHFHNILQNMTDRNVDIMGFSETNIEWYDPKLNQTLYQTMKKHLPGGHWTPSTSKYRRDPPINQGVRY